MCDCAQYGGYPPCMKCVPEPKASFKESAMRNLESKLNHVISARARTTSEHQIGIYNEILRKLNQRYEEIMLNVD